MNCGFSRQMFLITAVSAAVAGPNVNTGMQNAKYIRFILKNVQNLLPKISQKRKNGFFCGPCFATPEPASLSL